SQFQPLNVIAGLALAINNNSGKLFTGTHVDRVKGGKDAYVMAGGYTVSAQAVVVATNAPINDRFFMCTKQAPYMTYVIGARVPAGSDHIRHVGRLFRSEEHTSELQSRGHL